MKKFIFLPVLLCLLVNISFSQDELKKTEGLVKWSEVYKFVQFRVGAQLAGYDDKFVYIFQGSRKKMVMEKYDLTTFELTQSAPILFTSI